jgi:D-3-phosphoglycerate dehydrogenase
MIALQHRLGPAMSLVRGGGWKQVVGRQLSGCVVGVVGLGHVGQELTRLLQPFGCRVVASDIRDLSEFAGRHGVTMLPLGDLLAQADVVTLHVPLTAATRGMIGEEALARMRPGSVLVNTARGGVVDEAALLTALREGKLAGAAIDVFAVEPPNDLELARLPSVLATPHIGGSSEEAILAMGRAALEGLEHASDPLTLIPSYLRRP